jgi:hypothetical protein
VYEESPVTRQKQYKFCLYLTIDLIESITIILRTNVLHNISDWQSDKYVLVNTL